MSKGSTRRPAQVSAQTYRDNHDRTFGSGASAQAGLQNQPSLGQHEVDLCPNCDRPVIECVYECYNDG